MIGQTVTVLRSTPGGYDADGDPVTSTTAEHDIEGCAVAPRTSEPVDGRGRQGVIVGLTLYAPAGADLLHTDQVRIDGVVYEIDGEPGVWRSPYSDTVAGIEVALARGEG